MRHNLNILSNVIVVTAILLIMIIWSIVVSKRGTGLLVDYNIVRESSIREIRPLVGGVLGTILGASIFEYIIEGGYINF
jgi:hypothetical protein